MVSRLFDAFQRHDLVWALDLIDKDAVWTFPGRRGRIAGEHRGREAIVRFLTDVMVLTGGTFNLELHEIAAADSSAVALFTGSGTRDGKTLNNPTALHVKVRNGRAVEFREYVWDLDHVEDFWS